MAEEVSVIWGTIQPDTITDLFFKSDLLNIVQAHFFVCFSIGQDKDWWRCLEDMWGGNGSQFGMGTDSVNSKLHI